MSQCPDCGATFSPGEAACPECGMELYDDPEAEEHEPDEPAPRSHVDVHDRPGWDELVRESRTRSRDSLRKAKESRHMTASKQQYGVRWPTGSVFAFPSREAAESAITEDGRGVGVLVVCEYEPGTANATEWREVED